MPSDDRRTKLEERFWSKVSKAGECWEWQGSKRHGGYGAFCVNGRDEQAHRIAYELAYGPIPEGQQVLHRCDNPPCIRPDHLFLGTYLDNMVDACRKGRHRNPVLLGSAHPHAKVNEDTVRLIRARLAVGDISRRRLATELGISRHIVDDIALGRCWAHVY